MAIVFFLEVYKMKIRTIEIFEFSELPQLAKLTAIENYRNSGVLFIDDNYYENVYSDSATVSDYFGLNIALRSNKSDIYFDTGRNSYLSFNGRYSYKQQALKSLKKYAPIDSELSRIVKSLQDIQKRNFYSIVANCSHSRNYMDVTVERNDDKKLSVNDESDIKELLLDFANWILTQIESEIEYRYSDNAIIESIECNEYEFLISGELA
jgi:hypothetical protein